MAACPGFASRRCAAGKQDARLVRGMGQSSSQGAWEPAVATEHACLAFFSCQNTAVWEQKVICQPDGKWFCKCKGAFLCNFQLGQDSRQPNVPK